MYIIDMIQTESIGLIETQYAQFDSIELESGRVLKDITIAYETYGTLNSDKSNAILVTHAFTGDAHAAGYHKGERKPGWWDNMIGPGKAFDTERYFIISSNVLGGCKGSTGPESIDPETGRPFGLSFPFVSIRDMVEAQRMLVDRLEIDSLLSVVGGSMGGMQVLQWMVSYPDRIHSAIPIATTVKHSPQQIAFNEVGRQAIMADPNWNGGDYYNSEPPARGLAVARMVGHITYMSDHSMAEKFGRKVKTGRQAENFTPYFEVEGYLKYRGDSFVSRFGANTYLYITKAMDHFDLADGQPLYQVFQGLDVRVFVISFKSDWLYPSYQSEQIIKACKMAGINANYIEVESTYGHDAFLLEVDRQSRLVSDFLRSVYEERRRRP